MVEPFFEQPILNSPYEPPRRHDTPSEHGPPLDQPPIEGWRPSKYITPVPPAKKQKGRAKNPAATVARPFPRPSSGRIAVKVNNHFGGQVMKVFGA